MHSGLEKTQFKKKNFLYIFFPQKSINRINYKERGKLFLLVPLVLDAKLSCYAAAEFIDIKLIDLIALYTNRKIILIV